MAAIKFLSSVMLKAKMWKNDRCGLFCERTTL